MRSSFVGSVEPTAQLNKHLFDLDVAGSTFGTSTITVTSHWRFKKNCAFIVLNNDQPPVAPIGAILDGGDRDSGGKWTTVFPKAVKAAVKRDPARTSPVLSS